MSRSPAGAPVVTVGLDADDTLWHCEPHFKLIEARFADLIANRGVAEEVDAHLMAVERRNLEIFGYGVKGFTLSMIETAIQLTDGAISGDDVATIVGWGKEMLAHPVELLPGVAETVEALTEHYQVVVMTKGDLLHQESKVASSGLGDVVHGVEVFGEKDVATYQRILDRRGIDVGGFVMVGNSITSDIAPVLELGGRAIHIPYEVNWALDHTEGDGNGYVEIERFDQLPEALERLAP